MTSLVPSPPPLSIPLPIQEPGSSRPSRPATDRGSSPDPFARNSTAAPRRRAAPAPTAATEASAVTTASHAANGAIGVVHAIPMPASMNGAVPTSGVASTGTAGARTTPSATTQPTPGALTVLLATPAATANAAAAAGADGHPPLDRDATLDAGCGHCARIVTAVTAHVGADTTHTKTVTDDPAVVPEGRSSGPASASEPRRSPPRPSPPTPAERGAL